MNNVKDALLRLVHAGLETKKMQEAYLTVGLDDNKLFDVYGSILDAIYNIVGEHTETFEESVTYISMTAPILTEERRWKMLVAEYAKRNPEQPQPYTFERKDMKELHEKNGGYMTPEGDWS